MYSADILLDVSILGNMERGTEQAISFLTALQCFHNNEFDTELVGV
jgi:hypothetical protein